LNLCLFLLPVCTILVPVGRRLSLVPVPVDDFSGLPENLDLSLVLGGVSVTPSSSSSSSSSCCPGRVLPLSLALSPEVSNLGLTLLLPAVPVLSVLSDWNRELAGVLLIIPLTETGSTERAVTGSSLLDTGIEWNGDTLGPVGNLELGKVVCSTDSLGGNILLSGPLLPKPDSGCRRTEEGWNRKPDIEEGPLGNLSRFVTAGTVGTESENGR